VGVLDQFIHASLLIYAQHSSTPSPTPVNGVHDMYDATVLEQQIKHRENKIVELEKQVASYHDRCMILEAEVLDFLSFLPFANGL
jgi:hypothetical protein